MAKRPRRNHSPAFKAKVALAAVKARACIGRYLDFYNRRRPHSSLDGMTPDCAYFGSPPLRLAA
jgi:hypothetical protein